MNVTEERNQWRKARRAHSFVLLSAPSGHVWLIYTVIIESLQYAAVLKFNFEMDSNDFVIKRPFAWTKQRLNQPLSQFASIFILLFILKGQVLKK